MTVDGQINPFNSNGTQDPNTPGAWDFGDTAFTSNPMTTPVGHQATVSFSWSDGLGAGGSHSQLVGIPDCAVPRSGVSSAIATDMNGDAYWQATLNGNVDVIDSSSSVARNYGDMNELTLNAPVVGLAAIPGGQGYWLLGGDGGIFSFGLAQFYGSTGAMHLNAPVVGMATTPDGAGYWLVARDGGVFSFGDAKFYGSMGGQALNSPIVGMTVDQATGGYWLVASDGGVFSFNAPFHGSTGGLTLSQPVVGMEAAPDGSGYRLAARDGGVFSFDLPFEGSYVGRTQNPMVGIVGQGSDGYWLLDGCGGVYTFGSAQFHGSGLGC